ncbi:DNA mismatch repair protein MutS [Papiliotrema laurentii]|uniref:DNA mismatch repair protein MutS n=1 Tax=Papiliotrema laurentii TaxID=5418 RepID=A0AAD9CZJ1_PAPLA|nr:DNA mismatch repair protein MutS [Papiliotrema laurentii]
MVDSGNAESHIRHNSSRIVQPQTQARLIKLSSARASSVGEPEKYVVAVIQGRGLEIGICVVSLSTGKTYLTQLADGPSFARTLQHLYLYPPLAVLLPDTGHSSSQNTAGSAEHLLAKVLENTFSVQIHWVRREYWNDECGLKYLKTLAVENDHRVAMIASVADRHSALSAAGALFEWLKINDLTFATHSVPIFCAATSGTMFVDAQTAMDLELVSNHLTRKTADTLFGTLNRCYTPMGARLLRSNLLQPINDQEVIERRLDAIHELARGSVGLETLRSLRDNLHAIKHIDLDNILAQVGDLSVPLAEGKLSQEVSFKAKRDPETRIGLLSQLNQAIQVLSTLRDCLADSQSPLLQSLSLRLTSSGSAELRRRLLETLEDQPISASRGLVARGMRLFAIKKDVDSLLDVARTVYTDTRRDINEMAVAIGSLESIDCDAIHTKAGFRFRIKRQDAPAALPRSFINQDRQRKHILFATHELMVANNRLRGSEQEIMDISTRIIQGMEETVVAHSGSLYECSEALAIIDLLAGLATVCSINSSWDTMAIKAGKHPILERNLRLDCVPNDVYATEDVANFQLVQGPNMSGKSTYLRQIGLLVIQAMLGCHVPADYASIKLHDSLLTRLSNQDSMERSLSTFAAEIAATAMIFGA